MNRYILSFSAVLISSILSVYFFAFGFNESNVQITHIRTDPYYEKYLYSFKIEVFEETLEKYKIELTSDIDSKLVQSKSEIEPGDYSIWGNLH